MNLPVIQVPVAETLIWPPEENNRHADIDGDVLAYQVAFACSQETPKETQKGVDNTLKRIVRDAGCSSWTVHLTGQDNFRVPLATIQPYKGNRVGTEKPKYLPLVRDYLKEYWGAYEHSDMEADDGMSISHHYSLAPDTPVFKTSLDWSPPRDKQHIICTIDKDLQGVSGAFLYNWDKSKHQQMDYLDARCFFYKQLLTGDTVDHIKGLSLTREEAFIFGDQGALSSTQTISWVRELDHCKTVGEMYSTVLAAYEERHCDLQYFQDDLTEALQQCLLLGPEDTLLENARLLHMLEYPGEMWNPPLRIVS